MASLAVRVDETTHKRLRELAGLEGRTMQEVLVDAIEDYRRKRFLRDANAAFAALRQDAKAWIEEQKERGAWDVALMDGEGRTRKQEKT